MEIKLFIQGKFQFLEITTIVLPVYGPHYVVVTGNELTEDDVRSYPVKDINLVLDILNKFLVSNK